MDKLGYLSFYSYFSFLYIIILCIDCVFFFFIAGLFDWIVLFDSKLYIAEGILSCVLTVDMGYIFSVSMKYASGNYRANIDKAKKFKKAHLGQSAKIDALIEETRQTKESKKMNAWINNFKELQNVQKNLMQLQKNKKELPGKIEKAEKLLKKLVAEVR